MFGRYPRILLERPDRDLIRELTMTQHTIEFLTRLQAQFDVCGELENQCTTQKEGITMSTRKARMDATSALVNMIVEEVEGLSVQLEEAKKSLAGRRPGWGDGGD